MNKSMKTIKIRSWNDIPKNYTGKIEWSDGDVWWYEDGKSHKENGPAVEYNDGSKAWYINNKCHRTDGPAFECIDGSVEYWINNKNVSKLEMELFNWLFPENK